MTEAAFIPPTEVAEEAPKKKAKAKAKAEGAKRRSKFAEIYPDDAPITVLVDENPKKEGSKAREMFKGYKKAKNVRDARAAGVTYQCIAYDVGRGFIKVG